MTETTNKLPIIFGPHVLIKPKEIEKKTASGIILAHKNEEVKQGAVTEGTVVQIGPLAFKDDLNPSGEAWYEVGARVIFKKYAGTNITFDKVMYILLNYEDVMGLIPEDMVVDTDPEKLNG